MKYKVNLTLSAERDLFEIYRYIFLNDSPDMADNIILKLHSKCSALKNYPDRGHIPPELDLLGVHDFLEITYKPYRIIYRIIKKEVFVLCILDGRHDMQKLLQDRLVRD